MGQVVSGVVCGRYDRTGHLETIHEGAEYQGA